MRFSKTHRVRNSSDNALLPLTNIVFLIVIVLMVAGHLITPQASGVKPPHSISTAAARHGLEVEITADGKLALAGQTITRDKLKAKVHARLQKRPGLALRLRADGKTSATRVVAVMRTLHAAGAHKLRLITLSKNG
jgi:biopolymer transport protein ExbD